MLDSIDAGNNQHTERLKDKMLHAIVAGREAQRRIDAGALPDELVELERAVREGEQCRDNLILYYLPLITILTKRYDYTGVPLEDLKQETILSTLEAIDKYKAGTAFPQIKMLVRQTLHRLIGRESHIRIEPQMQRALRKVKTVVKFMENISGQPPTAEHVATEMNAPIGIIRKLLHYLHASQTYTLDAPVQSEDSDCSFGDLIAAQGTPMEEEIEQIDLRTQMLDVLSTLEPLEESTIKLRFGFIGGEIYSAWEVAQELHVKQQEEEWLEVKAMRKLRHPSRSMLLREYL